MGVPPEDCRKVGELVGIKTFINEFVAYMSLRDLIANSNTFNAYNGNWSYVGDDVYLHGTNQTLVGGILTVSTEIRR